MSGDEVKTLWTLEDGARSSVSAKRSEAKVTLRVTGGHTEKPNVPLSELRVWE